MTGGDGGSDADDDDDEEEEKFMTCWSRSWDGCVTNRVWTLGFVIFLVGNGGDFIALGLTKASIVTLVSVLRFVFFFCCVGNRQWRRLHCARAHYLPYPPPPPHRWDLGL